MKKIACLFPGIGYTCDKPLLYYSWKLLSGFGWEIRPVPYTGFPAGVKGNPEKMRQCAETALSQAEKMLQDVKWREYTDILFISKSVGTVVSGAYAAKHGISCRSILFTPVEAAFTFPVMDAVAFHGTADPWADSDAIRKACIDQNVPLYITEKANHSLETGDVDADIENLRGVMRIVKDYAEGSSDPAPACRFRHS